MPGQVKLAKPQIHFKVGEKNKILNKDSLKKILKRILAC